MRCGGARSRGLAAADPGRVWECSHIGGCRFAPALVLLPHGFTFGGVPAGQAADLVRGYARGAVDPGWLRGRSSLAPVVQAARHHARELTRARGVDELQVLDVVPEGERGWQVRFSRPGVTVVLRERRVEPGRPLTCAATSPGVLRVFDLEQATR